MRNFWLGFAIAIVLIVLAGFLFVRYGFVDPRADIPVSSLEEKIAMPSLDAAVDRRAPDAEPNPADRRQPDCRHEDLSDELLELSWRHPHPSWNVCRCTVRSEERRVGKECRSR